MAPVVVAGVLVVRAVTVMGVTTGHTLGVIAVVVMSGGLGNVTARPVMVAMVVVRAHQSVSISVLPRGLISMGVIGVEQHAQDSWTAVSGSI